MVAEVYLLNHINQLIRAYMENIYVFSFVALLLFGGSAQADRQLANRNGCMSCHADTEADITPSNATTDNALPGQ